MATGNPPNNPINPQNIQQANADFQTQVDLLREVFDQANAIQSVLKDQLSLIKEINTEKYNQFDLANKLKEAEDDLNRSKSKNTDLAKTLNKLSNEGKDLEKRIVDGFKAKERLSARLTELRQKETALSEANARINRGDVTAIADQNRLIQEIANKKQSIADEESKVAALSNIISRDQATLARAFGEQEASLASQLIAMLEQEKVDKNAVQNLKAKLKYAQANNSVTKDYINYIKQTLGLTKETKNEFKEILGINKVLATLTLTGLLKSILAADQATTDFARNLGISRENSLQLTTSFIATQGRANTLNKNLNASLLTIQNQTEAQNQLNSSLGTANVFTEKQVADQVFLTKQLGLSGVEAANLLKLGVLNSQTTEDTYTTVADTVVQLRAQTGVALNFRKVLAEVAQISGQLAAQYKNNPKLLAQAVIQAQLLGLNLEQAAKQADTLLNFETSIENELKAELLTGKALNFERARSLALQGKSAEAAAELMKEAGGLEEFQNLNVLQQRALAESVGLTANEMADAVKQQRLLQETGFGTFEQLKAQADSIKDQTARQQFLNQIKQTASGEQLVAQYEQVSLQEKFNGLVETIQQNIVKLAEGPLGNVLHKLTDMLTKADSLKTIFKTIGAIIAFNIGSNIGKLISTGLPGMIRGAKLFSIQMRRGAIGAALTSAFAGNVAAIIGGAAAAAFAVSAIDSAMGDGGDTGGATAISQGGISIGGSAVTTTAAARNNTVEQTELLKSINNQLAKNNEKSITVNNSVSFGGKTMRDVTDFQNQASPGRLS